MIIYRVCGVDYWGYDYDEHFLVNYSDAMKVFQSLMNKAKEREDVVDREYFKEEVLKFREDNPDIILEAKYPFMMWKKGDTLYGRVPIWIRTSYEYQEYDIAGDLIQLKGIYVKEEI